MNRRNFLINLGLVSGAAACGCGGSSPAVLAPPGPSEADLSWGKAPCRYCGTGCGVEVGVRDGKVLAVRGDDAVKFLAAEMNALKFALSHRDETIALTRKLIHAKPDDARPAFVYDDAVTHKAVDPTLPLPLDKINWIQEQMVKAGKLPKAQDPAVITAPEYREKALKRVGQ